MAVSRGARPTRRRAQRSEATSRAKISVTVERSALNAIQAVTDNVSGFVNDAIKEKLYFARLDEEAELLREEGVEVNEAGYRWVLDRIDATSKRMARGG